MHLGLMNFLWLAFALTACIVLCGCSATKEDAVPPLGVSKVLYAKRDLSSGVFKPYMLNDGKAIGRVREAIREDVHAEKQPGDFGVGISVNHALLFYDSNNVMVFKAELLGDEYLIVDDNRHYARNTIKCLDALMQAEFRVATAEAMKGCDEINQYVGHVSTSQRSE